MIRYHPSQEKGIRKKCFILFIFAFFKHNVQIKLYFTSTFQLYFNDPLSSQITFAPRRNKRAFVDHPPATIPTFVLLPHTPGPSRPFIRYLTRALNHFPTLPFIPSTPASTQPHAFFISPDLECYSRPATSTPSPAAGVMEGVYVKAFLPRPLLLHAFACCWRYGGGVCQRPLSPTCCFYAFACYWGI